MLSIPFAKNRWRPQNYSNTGNQQSRAAPRREPPGGTWEMEAIETKQSKPARKHGTGLQLFKCGSPDRRHYCPGLRHCQHFPLALRKPGGPCAWTVRRASYSPQIKNATQNPRPMLSGAGIRPPLCGSAGCRYYRPRQRWLSALPTAEYGATLLACGKGASGARA